MPPKMMPENTKSTVSGIMHELHEEVVINRFQRAMERGHIWPAFQPIVDIGSSQLMGFEILARWTDPELGEICPSVFIPILENARLIDVFSKEIFRSACESAVNWEGKFFLALNVAPDQLIDGGFCDWIFAICSETGFPTTRIQIEITEGSLISNQAAAHRTLETLKALGVEISLDDFGKGYSSLARLEGFPFDKLKIDAQFVRGLCADKRKRRIVSAIIGLGQSLEIAVVAEGIETKDEAEILKALGCSLGQGWLYGKGVPASGVPDVISRFPDTSSPRPLSDTSPFQQLHQLQTLYEQTLVGLCFIDLNYRYVRTNESFASMHGMTKEIMDGKLIDNVLQGDLGENFKKDILKCKIMNVINVNNYIINGRCIKLFIEKVLDVAREEIGFSIVALDITEQKRISQLLHHSEAHLKRMAELTLVIAWTATSCGTVDYISPSPDDLPGQTVEERVKCWMSKIHPQDRHRIDSSWRQGISKANSEPREEYFRILSSNGTYREARSVAKPHFDQNGKIERWYGVVVEARAEGPLSSPVCKKTVFA